MRYKYYYDMNSKDFESIDIYLNDFFKNESKERKIGYHKKSSQNFDFDFGEFVESSTEY